MRSAVVAALALGAFVNPRGEAEAAGIPLVDLPAPYEGSGPLVSVPSTLIGGALGMAVGAVFVPPMILLSPLPFISLFDAIFGPLEVGWSLGKHIVGRIVGAPLWLTKQIVWDVPKAIIF